MLKIYTDGFSHEIYHPQIKVDVKKAVKKTIFDINHLSCGNLSFFKNMLVSFELQAMVKMQKLLI